MKKKNMIFGDLKNDSVVSTFDSILLQALVVLYYAFQSFLIFFHENYWAFNDFQCCHYLRDVYISQTVFFDNLECKRLSIDFRVYQTAGQVEVVFYDVVFVVYWDLEIKEKGLIILDTTANKISLLLRQGKTRRLLFVGMFRWQSALFVGFKIENFQSNPWIKVDNLSPDQSGVDFLA